MLESYSGPSHPSLYTRSPYRQGAGERTDIHVRSAPRVRRDSYQSVLHTRRCADCARNSRPVSSCLPRIRATHFVMDDQLSSPGRDRLCRPPENCRPVRAVAISESVVPGIQRPLTTVERRGEIVRRFEGSGRVFVSQNFRQRQIRVPPRRLEIRSCRGSRIAKLLLALSRTQPRHPRPVTPLIGRRVTCERSRGPF